MNEVGVYVPSAKRTAYSINNVPAPPVTAAVVYVMIASVVPTLASNPAAVAPVPDNVKPNTPAVPEMVVAAVISVPLRDSLIVAVEPVVTVVVA